MTRQLDRQLSELETAVALHSAIRTRVVRDTQRSPFAPPRVPRECLPQTPEPQDGANPLAVGTLWGLLAGSALLAQGSPLLAALVFALTVALGCGARNY